MQQLQDVQTRLFQLLWNVEATSIEGKSHQRQGPSGEKGGDKTLEQQLTWRLTLTSIRLNLRCDKELM
jgi:hypothetical protein